MRLTRTAVALVIVLLAVAGCSGLPFVGNLLGQATTAPTATQQPAPTFAPTVTEPPAPTPEPPTSVPTPQPAVPTLPPTFTPAPTVPPVQGTFDVYVSAPMEDGTQLIRWINLANGERSTEVRVTALADSIVRAGQYVYWVTPDHVPQRANTAGSVETLAFAQRQLPVDGTYQFVPSANGDWLAWLVHDRAAGTYQIEIAYRDGSGARAVTSASVTAGSAVEIVRVTNNGTTVYIDIQPPEMAPSPTFPGNYDLYAVAVSDGTLTHLPGEPPCGNRTCSARISPDGAYLVRTLPPGLAPAPVVVTNLVSGAAIARFVPPGIPADTAFDIGNPFFTPGGELVYSEAIIQAGITSYRLVFANIVTGEQRELVDLGANPHYPLGWTGGGFILLTTREPDLYDTWQIDVRDDSIRQIASMLFLGTINEPPLGPR